MNSSTVGDTIGGNSAGAGSARPIALIGLSGSGKSTVGPLLADRLGRNFVDLDRLVASEAQMSIPTIFERLGERAFRKLEVQALESALADSNTVMSTGAGVVTSGAARKLLASRTSPVWLAGDPSVLVARLVEGLADDGEPRPLLGEDVDSEKAEIALRRMLTEREAWYSELAAATVDVTVLSPNAVTKAILETLDD